jgi:hypothetical protein
MAATYAQLGVITTQPDFQWRVQVALMSAANNVYNEGTGVTGHAARATYSTKVMNGEYNLNPILFGVVSSSTIQANANPTVAGYGILDTDIQNQVNSMWNTLAGA